LGRRLLAPLWRALALGTSFTIDSPLQAENGVRAMVLAESRGVCMVAIAAAMFVGLFGWGAQYFGWADPENKVQRALVTSFVLGSVCGYKSQG